MNVESAWWVFIIIIIAYLVLVVPLAFSGTCRRECPWLFFAVSGCFEILCIVFNMGMGYVTSARYFVVPVLCFGLCLIYSFYQVGRYIKEREAQFEQ